MSIQANEICSWTLEGRKIWGTSHEKHKNIIVAVHPGKLIMEPKNHPIETEQSSSKTSIIKFHINFPRCSVFPKFPIYSNPSFWGYSAGISACEKGSQWIIALELLQMLLLQSLPLDETWQIQKENWFVVWVVLSLPSGKGRFVRDPLLKMVGDYHRKWDSPIYRCLRKVASACQESPFFETSDPGEDLESHNKMKSTNLDELLNIP